MLIHLRDAWNKQFPTHAIPTSLRRKDELWAAIRDRIRKQYDCATEFCALSELGDSTTKAAGSRFFRPRKPETWTRDPTEWLDSNSIERVMDQYEEALPHFEFIGPVPIDFDARVGGDWGRCIVDELCALDLKAIHRRGTRSIGIVFNLDPHDKPGSHWVCAYIDMDAGAAYYYDSYGYEPCAEIRRFLRRCREQGCRQIIWNDRRHQRKGSECGMYCLYVLISLLQGRDFTTLCRERVDDDTVNALRDVLFATEKPRPQVGSAVSLVRPG